jgi:nucleoside-diphosphate-sugar epimerase
MTKRVLVTGATGFIGRHCLPLLTDLGYEVHATSSSARPTSTHGETWHTLDLLDPQAIPSVLRAARPTHLLHLAWYVVPGKLAEAPENFLWLQSSLELIRQFHQHGGARVLVTGTAYEYDWNFGYCSESITPRSPSTFYGTCKHALHVALEGYARRTGLSSAWARIFFLYGPHEHPDRLVPSVVRSLLRGEPARCSHGLQIRDYMHVEDVADGIVRLLDSDVTGPMNVASGRPIMLRDIVLEIARRIGAEDLVVLGAIPTRANDTPLVVADVTRLSEVLRWHPRYTLDDGLEQTIGWWRHHLHSGLAETAAALVGRS